MTVEVKFLSHFEPLFISMLGCFLLFLSNRKLFWKKVDLGAMALNCMYDKDYYFSQNLSLGHQ